MFNKVIVFTFINIPLAPISRIALYLLNYPIKGFFLLQSTIWSKNYFHHKTNT